MTKEKGGGVRIITKGVSGSQKGFQGHKGVSGPSQKGFQGHKGVSGAQRGFIVTKGFRVVKGGFSHTYPSDQCRMSIVHFIFRQNS